MTGGGFLLAATLSISRAVYVLRRFGPRTISK